jgi:hypothetical protein
MDSSTKERLDSPHFDPLFIFKQFLVGRTISDIANFHNVTLLEIETCLRSELLKAQHGLHSN